MKTNELSAVLVDILYHAENSLNAKLNSIESAKIQLKFNKLVSQLDSLKIEWATIDNKVNPEFGKPLVQEVTEAKKE
jgi:hypothetical protein